MQLNKLILLDTSTNVHVVVRCVDPDSQPEEMPVMTVGFTCMIRPCMHVQNVKYMHCYIKYVACLHHL